MDTPKIFSLTVSLFIIQFHKNVMKNLMQDFTFVEIVYT